MSRPFSYNDENFTVIGNVLFVYFKYDDAAEADSRLLEIPPAISDRLLFFSNVFNVVYAIEGANASSIMLTVKEYDNKCYLVNKTTFVSGRNRYIYGTFILKDI